MDIKLSPQVIETRAMTSSVKLLSLRRATVRVSLIAMLGAVVIFYFCSEILTILVQWHKASLSAFDVLNYCRVWIYAISLWLTGSWFIAKREASLDVYRESVNAILEAI
jgi:hypothetical protein